MKPLAITLLISMLPSLLTISYAGDSVGKNSPVLPTGTNSLAIDEQWSQFTQLVDKDDYTNLELFLNNLENKKLFLKSQYTEEYKSETTMCTPLHYASMLATPRVIGLLISHGASVYATATYEATPLHYAVLAQNLATIHSLLLANSSLESGDDRKVTPLHMAILTKNLDIIACFIDHMLTEPKSKSRKEKNTVALKAQDSLDNTPVHYAFSSENEAIPTRIVEVLTTLDPGDIACIMQTQNEKGETPQEIIQNQPSFSALQKKINQKILALRSTFIK